MSDFNSSIGEKKRIILKNPDGSYFHCFKIGEKESIVNINKPEMKNNLENFSMSDEDLRYIVENADYYDTNLLIEQIVDLFKRYSIIYIFLKLMELTLTVFLMFLTWDKRESTIYAINKIYTGMDESSAKWLFYIIFVTSNILNIIFYLLGILTLTKMNVKYAKIYSDMALFMSISTIMLVYLNIIFILLFILRLILYGFSRFLLNLLISILLLPRPEFNTNYNTI